MAGADPYASYLQRAEELFASGDVVQAGQIWQAILKREPAHAEAREGLLRVKAHLEALTALPPLPSPPQPPAGPTLPQDDPEIARLLDQGCTLYDSGHVEDALRKWEKILARNPDHAMARGYINGARKRLGQSPLPQFAPPPSPPPPGDAEVRATIVQPLPAPPSQAPPEFLSPRATVEGQQPLQPQTAPEAPALIPAPPEVPAAPLRPEPEKDKWLREGCTLYDMGQTEEALRCWERIIAVDPGHALALEYIKGARRDLGLPPLGSIAPAPPPALTAPPSGESRTVEQLLREAAQLYDMGLAEEATQRWKRVLELSPGHREAEAYLLMASAPTTPDSATLLVAPVVPTPDPSPAPAENPTERIVLTPTGAAPETPTEVIPLSLDRTNASPAGAREVVELKLHQAERLLQLRHVDEAVYAFQRVLQLDPQNARALEGQAEALALQAAQEPVAADSTPGAEPVAAHPPAALTAQVPVRKGLPVPAPLADVAAHPLLQNPVVLIGGAAALVVVVVGLFYLQSVRRDRALRAAVLRERETALASREASIPDLAESLDTIKQEASTALSEDPLRAYFRAQEAHRLDAADAGAASLLERARTALTEMDANPGNFKDYQRFLQSGDLDSAEKALRAHLCTSPDDFDLRHRQARLCLAMAQILAAREDWEAARTRLRLGRAMFPQDRSWQARLLLLDRIQTAPRADRSRWIPLLG